MWVLPPCYTAATPNQPVFSTTWLGDWPGRSVAAFRGIGQRRDESYAACCGRADVVGNSRTCMGARPRVVAGLELTAEVVGDRPRSLGVLRHAQDRAAASRGSTRPRSRPRGSGQIRRTRPRVLHPQLDDHATRATRVLLALDTTLVVGRADRRSRNRGLGRGGENLRSVVAGLQTSERADEQTVRGPSDRVELRSRDTGPTECGRDAGRMGQVAVLASIARGLVSHEMGDRDARAGMR
jgi:hypothetical protein